MNEVSTEAASTGDSNGVENTIVQYKVPFYEAAKRYLTKPTSKGRSSRSEFWWGLLFSFVLDLGFDGLFGATIIYNVCALAILFFDIFLWWRRIQDLGKSGWWCVVPFYNLYLAAQPSEMKENKYGPVPNTEPIAENSVLRKVVTGVIALCILSDVIAGCLGGSSRPSLTNFDTARFDTLEELARAVIENDVADRWDEFYRPMHLAKYTLEYKGKAMGVGHSFVAKFEPMGSSYFCPIHDGDTVRQAVQDRDWYYDSWWIDFGERDELMVDELEKDGVAKDNVLRFNELASRASRLPQLRILKKLTSAEMEDANFVYERAVIFAAMETKNGEVMLQPGTKPVFSEDRFNLFMSDDYINTQTNIYPVIVEGGRLGAKWKRAFEDYKKVIKALGGKQRVGVLRSKLHSFALAHDAQGRAKISALMNEELVKAIEDLKNLPERTEL